MDQPEIRPTRDDDLPRLLEINQANVPEVGSIDLDRMAFLVEESAIALTVVDGDGDGDDGDGDDGGGDGDGEIVGFCLVLPPGSTYDSVNYRWFMERHDDVLYLDRVAFDERFQGRGLGSALYAEVERVMADEHPRMTALTLEVNVEPPNEPSLRFHVKHGFEEVGRQQSKGIEVGLMLKPLP